MIYLTNNIWIYLACPENEVYTATFIGNGVINRWIFCVSSYLDKPT